MPAAISGPTGTPRNSATPRTVPTSSPATRCGCEPISATPRPPSHETKTPTAIASSDFQLTNECSSVDGGSVPLASVARIERIDGPVKVDRENAQRYVVVQSNVRDRDLVGFVEEAKAKIGQAVQLPTGYRIAWGGQFENQQRAAARLTLVVPLSLGVIFLVLFSTFGTVRQALLVLSNVPFALVGGIMALWLTGEYLSVPASVGFIALLGIAVLNGVVLVSYIRGLREQGRTVREAVVEGAKLRFRPVMMTATVAMLGLIPFLFSTGSEVQRPLAIVVIGGLITSTLLTLVVLPTIYRWFDEEGVEA